VGGAEVEAIYVVDVSDVGAGVGMDGIDFAMQEKGAAG